MTLPELLGAPYRAPDCKSGDWIDDEIEGRLQVGGWTSAPMSWPRRKKTGRAALILTPELARAVRTESAEAIALWWGVGATKVWQWRQALGVDRVTEGTRKLLQERTGVPPEAAARGRASAAAPEVLARMAESKRGKPAHPNTVAALQRAARRKKPAGFGVRANAWMLGRELPALHRGEWTMEEDAIVRANYRRRTVGDLGLLLGRTEESVRTRARTLGLVRVRNKWSAADDDFLRENYAVLSPKACAGRLGRTVDAVYERAALLKVAGERRAAQGRAVGGSRRWTSEEDAYLRSKYRWTSVEAMARELGRPANSVRHRAMALGLTKK